MLDHDEEFLESDEWADCVYDVRKEQLTQSSRPCRLNETVLLVQHVPYLGRQLMPAAILLGLFHATVNPELRTYFVHEHMNDCGHDAACKPAAQGCWTLPFALCWAGLGLAWLGLAGLGSWHTMFSASHGQRATAGAARHNPTGCAEHCFTTFSQPQGPNVPAAMLFQEALA